MLKRTELEVGFIKLERIDKNDQAKKKQLLCNSFHFESCIKMLSAERQKSCLYSQIETICLKKRLFVLLKVTEDAPYFIFICHNGRVKWRNAQKSENKHKKEALLEPRQEQKIK